MKIDIKSLRARLINYSEPVQVTSIDFHKGTFTWDYQGQHETEESLDYVESWEVEEKG
ncbi:hypothetical protein [Paenibacillus polymyxa]|uniref:hypothetical protein n=1 Tax=Paenibacillus polymyxa TaxID=1406 RepID=UPI0001E6D539|nr:hypothetical protein [Paenibacillus polymyxa]WPQ59922.1 hypothetical protein SKN87_27150 [Paenibacillus polymyxa]